MVGKVIGFWGVSKRRLHSLASYYHIFLEKALAKPSFVYNAQIQNDIKLQS